MNSWKQLDDSNKKDKIKLKDTKYGTPWILFVHAILSHFTSTIESFCNIFSICSIKGN